MEPTHMSMLQTKLDMLNKQASGGALTGEQLSKIRTNWRAAADSYSNSQNASQRELGHTLKEAVTKLDDFIDKSAPANVANAYRALRSQYKNLVTVETAASAAAGRPNHPGVFTPGQLLQASKNTASGMKRKAITQGKAPMQDLATAGTILKSTRPESGTTERLITAGLLGGGILGSGYAGKLGGEEKSYDWRIPAALALLSGGMYGARPMTKYMVGGYGLQDPIANLFQNFMRPPLSTAGAQLPALRKKEK